MKNKEILSQKNPFYSLYRIGFFIILALPMLYFSVWFYPPDFGKTIVFRSIMAIMLFLYLWQLLYQRGKIPITDLKKRVIVWALGLVFLVFFLASVFSVEPYFSFWSWPVRSGGFVNFAFFIAFAMLAFLIIKKEDWIKFWNFSIGIGLLVCFIAIAQFFGPFKNILPIVDNRPSSTVGNPIFLGMYLLFLTLMSLALFLKEGNKYLRLFYIFSSIIFFYTIVLTESRACYIGLVAGVIVFLINYPKKYLFLKILIISCLIAAALAVSIANAPSYFPEFVQHNRVIQSLSPRLKFQALYNEGRLSAWKISAQAIQNRPLLGWGPENYPVGFDKYYDPKTIPFNNDNSDWWDRAHNIFLDVGVQAGLLGIFSYLFLLFALFWQIYKLKKNAGNENEKVAIVGIQAILVSYIAANFLSFDSFVTYLMFFFTIGYILSLQQENPIETPKHIKIPKFIKHIIFSLAAIVLIVFLFNYNVVPLEVNAEINVAEILANAKQCDQAFLVMDKALQKHTFLDSYTRLEYVEFTIPCNIFHPENNSLYAQKGLELITQAAQIQPTYTRYWLALGTYENDLALKEKDPATKKDLLQKAEYYLDKAFQLSPKHQEIILEKARTDIIGGEYSKAESDAEHCIKLNDKLGNCYFTLAMSHIYLGKTEEAASDVRKASEKGLSINTPETISDLIDAYVATKNYAEAIKSNLQLLTFDPSNVQYHASLAFIYKAAGDYTKARKEALTVLQLSPQSKENVEEFLQTLPY